MQLFHRWAGLFLLSLVVPLVAIDTTTTTTSSSSSSTTNDSSSSSSSSTTPDRDSVHAQTTSATVVPPDASSTDSSSSEASSNQSVTPSSAAEATAAKDDTAETPPPQIASASSSSSSSPPHVTRAMAESHPVAPISPKQRMWGTPPQHDEIDESTQGVVSEDAQIPKEDGAPTTTTHTATITAATATASTTTSASTTASSFPHHHNHHHPPNVHVPFKPKTGTALTPPPGFVIAARVYIDTTDKLAYIDQDQLTLPYWDCGAAGSTTSPLAVKEATFRHSLTPGQAWTATPDGKHPYLCIALSEFLLEVSSGDSKVIQPGQVILLEDVLIPGHKMRPLHHADVRVMFLTLPKTHYATGKDALSLPTTVVQNDPCPVSSSPEEGGVGPQQQQRRTLTMPKALQREVRDARLLRIALGLTGLSVSTLLADFLGKTAPLWLAVGVGGSCFVAAGTAGTVALGEALVSSIQAWRQQRRLHNIINSSTNDPPPVPIIPKVDGVPP